MEMCGYGGCASSIRLKGKGKGDIEWKISVKIIIRKKGGG
jgi:hypothetical protein